MTEYRPSGMRQGEAAGPMGQGRAPRGTGDQRAAIVIVCQDTKEREDLGEWRSRRGGFEPVQVTGGTGTDHLESLVLEDRQSGVRHTVPADGLFVLIGSEPPAEWLGASVARDRWGFILRQDVPDDTDGSWPGGRQPLPHESSLPGVFAAGDVRHGSVKPVASAVGEGAVTIPLVHHYLESIAVPEAARR